MELKGKEFAEHHSGLFVSRDGEVYVPKSGNINAHFTYGTYNHNYRQVMYKGKCYYIHRLVAECFIPNPNNYVEVDHIDRDPSNNNVTNLRWADRSIQMKNRRKFTSQNNTALSKAVLQYTPDGELVREWPSTAECQRNGFHSGAVSMCCRGKFKQHKGYIFKYKEEELEEV